MSHTGNDHKEATAENDLLVRPVDAKGEVFAPAPAPPAVSASEEEEEGEEDFPEDYEDYYPRGLLDASSLEALDNHIGFTLENKREDVRGRLAIIYTIATFFMFFLGFLVAILDAAVRGTSIIENLSVILPLLSGLFLGSLGFVLGYYFRKFESEK